MCTLHDLPVSALTRKCVNCYNFIEHESEHCLTRNHENIGQFALYRWKERKRLSKCLSQPCNKLLANHRESHKLCHSLHVLWKKASYNFTFPLLIFFILFSCLTPLVSSYRDEQLSKLNRNVRVLPQREGSALCMTPEGDVGVCMFLKPCLEMKGTLAGTCFNKFYFASCCVLDGNVTHILNNNNTHSQSTPNLIDSAHTGPEYDIDSDAFQEAAKVKTTKPTTTERASTTQPTTQSTTTSPSTAPTSTPKLEKSSTVKPSLIFWWHVTEKSQTKKLPLVIQSVASTPRATPSTISTTEITTTTAATTTTRKATTTRKQSTTSSTTTSSSTTSTTTTPTSTTTSSTSTTTTTTPRPTTITAEESTTRMSVHTFRPRFTTTPKPSKKKPIKQPAELFAFEKKKATKKPPGLLLLQSSSPSTESCKC